MVIEITCINVVGGWQSAVKSPNINYPFGPIFNSINDLWEWQRNNLPPSPLPVSFVHLEDGLDV